MVRDRGLGELEERHQLTDADLAGVLSENVHELEADRVAEGLRDLGHPDRVLALDVGVDDRLAAGLAGRSLLLRRELQIDSHRSICID